ncbi:uncharacterized protein LOC111106453 [Crassostrea virginica]|uniref:Tripartite motif-containing protein 45-like n=1 Tax=Crassostrea virginica TaxID=6565 RepID=A0A8B8B096_CRAVI|nr:tripartite motif-containing protein 45-like [Crassostrea virginica]
MNPSKSGQDVLRCHLCEIPVPPLCCHICHIYLCKVCAGEHILDESTKHLVVPIKQTLSALLYPKCLKHSSRNCELYCEQCTIPICVQCVSSEEHRGHGFKDLLECVQRKRKKSETDLQELESSILIEHKEFAYRIRNQKVNLDKTVKELKTSIDQHGEKLHRQVSEVVEEFKSQIDKKHEERFAVLTKAEEKNAFTISDIEKCILKVKELQTSRDLGLVFEYKSRNEEFRNIPPNHNITLPTFAASEIKKIKLFELFGSLAMTSKEMKSIGQDVKSNQVMPVSYTRECCIKTPYDNPYTLKGFTQAQDENKPQYYKRQILTRNSASKTGNMCGGSSLPTWKERNETESFDKPSPTTPRKSILSIKGRIRKYRKRVTFTVENEEMEQYKAEESKFRFATEKYPRSHSMYKLDGSDVSRKDIKIVMLLTNVSESTAISAIRQSSDIVHAIMTLRRR